MASRRDFLQVASAAAVGAVLPQMAKGEVTAGPEAIRVPLLVSTWPFGQAVNRAARQRLEEGGSGLDAVEAGIHVAEADAGNHSVGIGGHPNAAGVVQLDACIMSGRDYRAGSVAALEGIAHPISVARRVMEQTPHVMLVGAGAREFALSQGFPETELLTDESRAAWERWRRERSGEGDGASHDTIALLVLAAAGDLAGGCSTSGAAYKLPGRVGDSPVIGSGLYVDGQVGAAGATGLGEDVMRHGASLLVVEAMARGLDPQAACEQTLRRLAGRDPRGFGLDFHLIALDIYARYGGAGTRAGFRYAVTDDSGTRLLDGVHVHG